MKNLQETIEILLCLTLHNNVRQHDGAISRKFDYGLRVIELIKDIGILFNAKHLLAIDWHNRFENGVEFIYHNLENHLPFSDEHFDIIICNDVIEHVEMKTQLLTELLRTSSRYVVISLPNTQHWMYILGLIRGNMSKQCIFNVKDSVNKHRWITYYNQNIDFSNTNLNNDYIIVSIINTVPLARFGTMWFVKLFKNFFVYNQGFFLKKNLNFNFHFMN